MQYNNLLKRINKKNSQANFYFKSAIGSTHSDEHPFSNHKVPAGFIGFATDGNIEDSLLLMKISIIIHQILQNIFSKRLGLVSHPT